MIDVTQKLWGFCNTLRDEGIGYGKYIEQLTFLLFLKMAQEKGVEIPAGYDWASLMKLKGTDLLVHYVNVLKELSKRGRLLGDIFAGARSEFRRPVHLRKLIDLIDEVEWTGLEVDVKGEAYEGLLQKYAEEEKGAGQYFTPRPIIRAIVQVIDPKVEETIHDPAVGTSGFLIGAFEHIMRKTHDGADLDREQRKILRTKTFSGCEIVLETRRLALMNSYLHEIEADIYYGDALSEGPHVRSFDVVMTNPPFGVKAGGEAPVRKDFIVKTANKQLNFVQHVMAILRMGGRAAIVVPDNVLFESEAGREVRKILLEDFNLHTILRLPNGTFLPYAGTKANLIFFRKGEPTKEVWVYDLRTNIERLTKKKKITSQHFEEFTELYKTGKDGNPVLDEREETERFKKFPMKEVEERDYNLDITWLRDESLEDPSKLPPPDLLASDALEKIKATSDELNDLLRFLELVEPEGSKEPYELPEGWKWVKLADVLEALESGKRPKGGVDRYIQGIPSIGGEHLTGDGGFNFQNIKFVPEDFFNNLAKGKIKKGDILLVKDGATTGKVSIVGDDFPFEKAAVNEHVFIIRSKSSSLLKYLFYHIFSREGQSQIRSSFRGLQGGINQRFVENYYLPLSLLEEDQKRIVTNIERAFAKVNRAEKFLEESGKRVERIKASLLSKAFRGEI